MFKIIQKVQNLHKTLTIFSFYPGKFQLVYSWGWLFTARGVSGLIDKEGIGGGFLRPRVFYAAGRQVRVGFQVQGGSGAE